VDRVIQDFAVRCPKLRVVYSSYEENDHKVVIIRGVQESRVQWVIQKWAGSDEPIVKDGERVWSWNDNTI
jgi:hypothetical protein